MLKPAAIQFCCVRPTQPTIFTIFFSSSFERDIIEAEENQLCDLDQTPKICVSMNFNCFDLFLCFVGKMNGLLLVLESLLCSLLPTTIYMVTVNVAAIFLPITQIHSPKSRHMTIQCLVVKTLSTYSIEGIEDRGNGKWPSSCLHDLMN